GIVTALPLIEGATPGEPFVVVSADIHSDYDYARLVPIVASIRARYPVHAAHLVLVDNPPWHAGGDMALIDGFIARDGEPKRTYSNIGVFHPGCFDDLTMHRPAQLFPWAYTLADEHRMTGTIHDGAWDNVGTPEQLAALDTRLREPPIPDA
ncbi:MAG: nucleotidyltransferase family protein, partial [Burkholderiaceae bacterium]